MQLAHGAAWMGKHLAVEIRKHLQGNQNRGLRSTITSGQCIAASHGQVCGIAEDDACCWLQGATQTLQRLWFG